MNMRNWAGNYEYGADRIHRPRTVDDIIDILRGSRKVRVLGSRHSFTDIVDAVELISLDDMDTAPIVDADSGTVTVPGRFTYAQVAQVLRPHGLALHNLASLPHVSVAGAIATATHGSGDSNGNLATAVSGLEMVNAAGQIITADRSDRDFDGVVVSLGGLGVVTKVTLDVEIDFEVEQHVYEGLQLDILAENFEEVMSAAYSVSAFTTFQDRASSVGHARVWIKRRVDGRDGSRRPGETFLGAVAAEVAHHPIQGQSADSCTEQFGLSGPWWDRLPHFRNAHEPSAGDEMQSEFFVPRRHAGAAIGALCGIASEIGDALRTSEIRTVAADELWMSPNYRRDSAAFHFTWKNDADLVQAAVAAIEGALAPFDVRPHWGKVFTADNFAADSYPRFGDFVELSRRLDPHGVFENEWWKRHIGSVAT